MEASPKNALGILNGLERQLGDATGSEMGSEEGETRRPVAQWTVAEVCSWLSSGPLGAQGRPLLEAARGHAISGKALLRLTEDTLERMGVVPGGLRRELLHEVLYLRIRQEMEDLLDIADSVKRRRLQPNEHLGLEAANLDHAPASPSHCSQLGFHQGHSFEGWRTAAAAAAAAAVA